MVWLSALFPAPPAEGLALSLTGGSPALPALGHTLVQTGRGLDKSQCRVTPHCVRSEEDVGEILISPTAIRTMSHPTCPSPTSCGDSFSALGEGYKASLWSSVNCGP